MTASRVKPAIPPRGRKKRRRASPPQVSPPQVIGSLELLYQVQDVGQHCARVATELAELRRFLVAYLTSRPDPLPPPENLGQLGRALNEQNRELARLRLDLNMLARRVPGATVQPDETERLCPDCVITDRGKLSPCVKHGAEQLK